jgi:EAL domain-containing protein (putative c-di-GMP-specific phosphodiesterase class I)
LLSFIVPVAGWIAIRGQERETAWTMLLMMTAMVTLRASEIARAGDASHPLVETVILGTVTALVVLLLQSVAADRRIALRRVAQQARQDMSTGLLNDRGLLAEFGERLASEQRPHYGLVGLHLTNFDTLNDLCGPMPAIQLEQSVAALLQRQPGLVAAARLSAGRYALLSEVRAVAREIYATVSGQVFRTVNGSIRLQSCVGGLMIDREAQINSEDCLVSLSEAQAIAASVREPQLFVEPLSQSMIDARRAHQSKIEKIRESIHEHRFQVHAQEIVDSQAPVGKLSYEVLIRLLDERGGLVKPPEFMSLAVQAQMTPAMDRGVIERVFGWLAAHPDAMARTHKCSINLSGLTMSDGTIASFIREQRMRHGIPPEIIVFEITESEAIRNPSAASRLVDELKADGFGIALDDFGVGLATFEYLKRFPIDFLKIDGSFVRNLINNPIDEEIVLSTVRVARRLNVQTVAEHVQDQAVYDRLLSLGVGHFQGEHLGRVMPIDELFRRPEPQGSPAARARAARTAPATGS